MTPRHVPWEFWLCLALVIFFTAFLVTDASAARRKRVFAKHVTQSHFKYKSVGRCLDRGRWSDACRPPCCMLSKSGKCVSCEAELK